MNKRLEPVTYKRFRFDGKSADGQSTDSLLSVQRGDGGALEAKVAMGLARLADEQFEKAANIATRMGAEASSAEARAKAPRPITVTQKDGGGYRVYTGSAIEQAKALLRDEEGFRPSPYWDTDAHRVGYGSDTVTLADGRSIRVTQGMTVSRADAERDLDYRLSAREGAQVRKQLGAAFDQLPASAQAALYSVGYNYGSLPDKVVAAARTGNLGAIADAVAALPANSKRRQREAAMIRGATGPAAPAGEGAPEAGAASSGPVTITPGAAGGWRPSGKDTAYGRAYDIAGTKTYLQELRFTMVQDMDAVYEAYKDDPAMLEKALGELETAHMRDHVFPEIADEYSLDFRKMAYTRVQQAREEFNTRQKARDRNDFLDRVGALEERKAQAFARAGMGDVGANMVLASLQNDIDSHIDSAVARGIYTPEEAKRAAKESRDGLMVGVYTAQAANKRPEEIAAMRQELYERWSRGEEPDIDAGTMAKIDEDLGKAERNRITQDKVASEALQQRGTDLVNKVARGQTPSPDEIARFELDRGTTPNGPEIVNSTLARMRVADALRNRPVGTVERDLDKLLQDKDGRVNPDDLQFARDKIKEYRTNLQNDPLGQAEALGIIPPVMPIPTDGTATPDQIRDAVAYRRGAAEAVASHFGVPPRYFRPGEAEAIIATAAENPDALVAFTQGVRDSFGSKAGAVLAEFSEEGPALAHAAGLSIATGDMGTARAVADAMMMKRQKQLPDLTPETARAVDNFGLSAVSGAFAADPKTQNAALQTAQLLFQREAARQGINVADIKEEGSPAQTLYLRVLDKALGARTVGGEAYGGIGEVNGAKIIVPSDMRKDQPAQLLGDITDAQLAQLPKINTLNDFKISASRIRGGTLVNVGDGRYLVALGEANGDDPQYLVGEGNRPWILDIRQLQEIAAQPAPNRIGGFNPFGWQP
ncbi:hypothetical protein J5N58_01205 [Rhizobium cremeum]|uniref:lysozyme n=1 Tax=Rhizobium cremeum TaxID=2813827 RepID=UPI001FD04B38|nr:hypothetical protein [Rhizobium cremeum]MCJ7993214.1 hypothetical protein [Rhizobium cremeum]MCJ7998279.1 hypothetical protein [Rhizobium cremeum]